MERAPGAPLSPCDEAQSDELLVLREIFGEDCIIDCDRPGEVAIRLHVVVDFRLADDGRIRLKAEAEAAPDDEQPGAGRGAAQPAGAPPPAGRDGDGAVADLVSELVEKRLKGSAPPWAALTLERSRSRTGVVYAEASVKHLPPITLQVGFPPDYPDSALPEVHIACEWLSSEKVGRLRAALDERAEGLLGSPVVYDWAEFLRGEAADVLGIRDAVVLADCVDPVATLLGQLQYDQEKELELWRNEIHQCGICFSEKPGTHCVHIGGCMHAFCAECIGEMARVHVTEGSILELRCPEPSCRAEISSSALQRVLDEPAYERWVRLKTQQILTTELENVVFCPRCEEMGRDVPTIAELSKSLEEAPMATCRRCGYVFCAKCRGLMHLRTADCIPEEERKLQVVLRAEVDVSRLSLAERRRIARGVICECALWTDLPKVNSRGCVIADVGPMQEGDEILEVCAGTAGNIGRCLWVKSGQVADRLEAALAQGPPLVIRFRAPGGGLAEQLKKKRILEELLTLQAVRKDSKACPKCKVRIMRSAGCNHMRCTQCDTHFCYRCGEAMPADSPYSHFSPGSCPMFG